MTAKAGSYSVAAITAPSPAQTAYSAKTDCTCDRRASSTAAPTDPAVITPRPPTRSMSAPTGADSRPLTSSPNEKAANTLGLSPPLASISGVIRKLNA